MQDDESPSMHFGSVDQVLKTEHAQLNDDLSKLNLFENAENQSSLSFDHSKVK